MARTHETAPASATELNLIGCVHSLFLVFVFSLGIGPALANVGSHGLLLSDIVFSALAVCWLLSLKFSSVEFKRNGLYVFLAIYLLAMILSVVFSERPRQSVIKLVGEIYLLSIPVITLNVVRTSEIFRRTLYSWLTGTLVAVVIGIGTLALFYSWPESGLLPYLTSHYGAVPVGNYPRLTAGFVSASMFFNYLSVGFVFLLIARHLGWIKPIPYWFLLAGIVVCSVFTFSSGLGAIFLIAACWQCLVSNEDRGFRVRVIRATGLIIAAAFLAVNFVALQPYPSAPYSWQVPGLPVSLFPSPRVLVWQQALETFTDNFFTGTGLATPSAHFVFQNTDGSVSLLTDAHNFLLSIAAQTGIAGLLSIILLCVYLLRAAFVSLMVKPAERLVARGLGIAFLSAFIYQGMTGSFEDARHLWVLIGLIGAIQAHSSQEQMPPGYN